MALDRALESVPHAFGGALALAYYAEPRATIDIDLNVFVGPERFGDVAAVLAPLGVSTDGTTAAEAIARDGQGRLMWDAFPLDLFFAYDAFHSTAAAAVQRVPFGDATIPILSVEHLVVCKVIFDRPKDWVDIDAVVTDETDVDVAEVLRWVGRIAGDADRRYERIAGVLTRR